MAFVATAEQQWVVHIARLDHNLLLTGQSEAYRIGAIVDCLRRYNKKNVTVGVAYAMRILYSTVYALAQ